ncbi:MAG: hypothetical protein JRF53_19070 [Deltaproteobacteria bacterium]|nr:hypothetical protein [Deltaproteobacteria bacterium]
MLPEPRTIEYYEKRFGIIAIGKGFIAPDELINALTVQAQEDIKYGTHRQIGEILLDQDIMSPNQIEEAVKAVIQA